MLRFNKRMVQELQVGSGAVSSFSGKTEGKERKFWLVVNTELIVYGATEPDALLTVQDDPVKLKPDGTFSLRFALPDGLQIVPVIAILSDGIDEKTITPSVKKTPNKYLLSK